MKKALKRLLQEIVRWFGYEVRRAGYLPLASDQLFVPWLNLLAQAGPIKTVFDVGANRGQTIRIFRPHMPEAVIHAFEPFEQPFDELQRVTKDDKRVKLHQKALGDRTGKATLYQNVKDDTNSLLPNSPGSDQFAPVDWMTPIGTTSVEVVRLDEVLKSELLDRIDILKIDAQGFERRILEGAGALLNPKTIRGVLLEILFVPYYEGQPWGGELIEFMRTKGYRLFGVSAVYYSLEYGWHWADALFVGAEVPEKPA